MYANIYLPINQMILRLYLHIDRFFELPSHKDDTHIRFSARRRCASSIGKEPNTKEQRVWVGRCESAGSIIHEIMHKLGKKYYLCL